ncbi:TauD/TfdA family dioxygenase [Phenylobacterium sp. LjRoot219]|uniref:TauD/TfdA dioxygenase family protein n=1 Tax=Phenylobacterium sp. LjRoot219 TaxID=3342283 RepID=UPI003ECFECB3
MPLEAVNLKPSIGSELKVTAGMLAEGGLAREIRDLLVQRGVLIARDVHLNDDQQRAFTRSLGDLRLGTVRKEGEEGLMKVTMDKKVNPEYAEFFPGTFFWHMDGTYDAVPPFATVLTPRVLSAEGGQTEFANTYAAYDALAEDEKAYFETLQVVHTMQAAMFPAVPDVPVSQMQKWFTYPERVHPLVWRHKSGRKSLALSTSASHVVGLHPADSRGLLDRLIAHTTQPQFVYRHDWRMGDVLIWDNTGTIHRVRPYDAGSGRELHRFTLNGEEPISAA